MYRGHSFMADMLSLLDDWYKDNSSYYGGINHWKEVASCSVGQSCMVVLEDGRLGMAPMNVQMGDVVALVVRSKLPLLLRKVSSPANDGRNGR